MFKAVSFITLLGNTSALLFYLFIGLLFNFSFFIYVFVFRFVVTFGFALSPEPLGAHLDLRMGTYISMS